MHQLAAAWQETRSFLQPQIAFLDVIRSALGEDGVFVDELTQVGFSARVVMPVYKPRTFISTGYQGTLGYGFPTALGVKVARPDVPVISVTGDGGCSAESAAYRRHSAIVRRVHCATFSLSKAGAPNRCR